MRTWALVSRETSAVVEWFPSRTDADEALAAVLHDEPDWKGIVYVAEFDVDPSGIAPAE